MKLYIIKLDITIIRKRLNIIKIYTGWFLVAMSTLTALVWSDILIIIDDSD